MHELLSDRESKVFRTIVDLFVETGKPVASRTLSQRITDEWLSPATLRNTMSDLEEWGLLKKAHHAAGRYPSEKGLQIYVDNMMAVRLPLYKERKDIETIGTQNTNAFDDAGETVSWLSEQMVFSVASSDNRMRVRGMDKLLDVDTIKPARKLVATFECTKTPDQVLAAAEKNEGVSVHIEQNTQVFDHHGFSMILTAVRSAKGQFAGALGIMGRPNQNYNRNVPLAAYAARALTSTLG